MKLSSLAVFSFAFLFSPLCLAISNIESVRLTDDSNVFVGSVGANISGRSGDKKQEVRDLNFRLDYTNFDNNILALYDTSFEKTNGDTSSDEEFYHLRYTRKLTKTFSLEVFSQRQTDRFLLLNHRALNGGGLRFQLHKEDKVWALYTGLGGYRTKERFSAPISVEESYNRYNSYLSGTWDIMEGLGLSNTAYFQPRTDDIDDHYVFNSLELGTSMIANLKLSFKHKIFFDSKPLADLPKMSRQYGLEVEWEF